MMMSASARTAVPSTSRSIDSHLLAGRRPRHARRAVVASSTPGSKIEKWLQTPFDIAAFGPRATFGALVSVPERLQTLQQDIEKVQELVQDPRPITEKGELLLQEVEETMVQFLQRGTTIETDVLANVKAMLPSEVADAVSTLVPPPPTSAADPYGSSAASSSSTAVDTDAVEVYYTSQSVSVNQPAAEMAELRSAVADLRASLETLRGNTDASNSNILKLNLREARDRLARRLQEVSPATAASQDPAVVAALREAGVLLQEVDGQFF